MLRRGSTVCACLAAAVLLVACAEPPRKEMDQAQGAIDAARAAGADQYAETEYSAATTALAQATGAVGARDYRLALNYALESHEHAQNAARDTANTKARMRAELERALGDIETLIATGRARIAAAGKTRAPRRAPRQAAADFSQATADLQKAREIVTAGDYIRADTVVKGIKGRVDKALAALDAASPRPARRRR
ncbi:MAG: DUF4398 domain-containing protein [Acidobacteria bacterium]|nr:DUF4398 domain-containing protein [Acidobacteriota bacterium]